MYKESQFGDYYVEVKLMAKDFKSLLITLLKKKKVLNKICDLQSDIKTFRNNKIK